MTDDRSRPPVTVVTHRDGVDWYHAPVRLRCVLGRHRAQTTGLIDGDIVIRCACGAFGGRGGWIHMDGGALRAWWRATVRRKRA